MSGKKLEALVNYLSAPADQKICARIVLFYKHSFVKWGSWASSYSQKSFLRYHPLEGKKMLFCRIECICFSHGFSC